MIARLRGLIPQTALAMSTNSAANGGGVFVSSYNPMTGKKEWKMQPEDYDYQQEVARAAFADMLHDAERVNL